MGSKMDPANSAKLRQIANIYAHEPKLYKIGILALPSGNIKISLFDPKGKVAFADGKALEVTMLKKAPFSAVTSLMNKVSDVMYRGEPLPPEEVLHTFLEMKGLLKGTMTSHHVSQVAKTIFESIPTNEIAAMPYCFDVISRTLQQTNSNEMVKEYQNNIKKPVDLATLRRDCHAVLPKTLISFEEKEVKKTVPLDQFLKSPKGELLVPQQKLRERLLTLAEDPNALSEDVEEDIALLKESPATANMLAQLGQAAFATVQSALWKGFSGVYADKDHDARMQSSKPTRNLTLIDDKTLGVDLGITYYFNTADQEGEPKNLFQLDVKIQREMDLISGKIKRSHISLHNMMLKETQFQDVFDGFLKDAQVFVQQVSFE